jgi:leader peptidase (prepilin peptidase)/N-methyltransferase
MHVLLVAASVAAGLVVGRMLVVVARVPWPLVVAAVTALVWGGVGARFAWSWATPALDVLCAGLVVLAGTDIDRRLLPKRIVYPTGAACAACLGAAAVFGGHWRQLGVAVVAALACYGAFLVVHLVNRRWLGYGDVRLAGLIGFVLGWLGSGYVLVALLVANLGGLLVAAALVATGRMGPKDPIPYGGFLAGGAIVAVLAGGALMR